MSCFSGSFASLPGVRCDRFDRLTGGLGVAGADQFFLSHCHADHMHGFPELVEFIRKKSRGSRLNHKLYCSAISKAFVLNKYKGLLPDRAVVELIPNEPKTVHVYDSKEIYSVRITAIGANHCPGSVMFLFERLDQDGAVCKRILYTGDFRYDSHRPLTDLSALHDGNKTPIAIDEMYLDTTFCSPQYETFPTRREAEEKIWELCQKWIKRNGMFKTTRNQHVILFHLPARYGYEGILRHVYSKSRNHWKVHVDVSKWSDYLCTTELSSCTEPDSGLAQWIHACGRPRHQDEKNHNKPLLKSLPCQAGEFEVCQIKPSAMYFTKKKMECLAQAGQDSVVSVSQGGSNYRVCYSCHSSLTELRVFVQHFSPQKITPCAIPPNSSRGEVGRILADFLDSGLSLLREPTTTTTSISLATLPGWNIAELSPVKIDLTETRKRRTDGGEESEDSLEWMSPSPGKRRRTTITTITTVIGDEEKDGEEEEPISSETRVSFDDTMPMEARYGRVPEDDSSEEEEDRPPPPPPSVCSGRPEWGKLEILPGFVEIPVLEDVAQDNVTIVTKRQTFARSKSQKTCYSMPASQDPEVGIAKERRFSMPSNMKMPIIKVTPSSPSPDPNHPDYPEFFQDRLYLEHVSMHLSLEKREELKSSRQSSGGQTISIVRIQPEVESEATRPAAADTAAAAVSRVDGPSRMTAKRKRDLIMLKPASDPDSGAVMDRGGDRTEVLLEAPGQKEKLYFGNDLQLYLSPSSPEDVEEEEEVEEGAQSQLSNRWRLPRQESMFKPEEEEEQEHSMEEEEVQSPAKKSRPEEAETSERYPRLRLDHQQDIQLYPENESRFTQSLFDEGEESRDSTPAHLTPVVTRSRADPAGGCILSPRHCEDAATHTEAEEKTEDVLEDDESSATNAITISDESELEVGESNVENVDEEKFTPEIEDIEKRILEKGDYTVEEMENIRRTKACIRNLIQID